MRKAIMALAMGVLALVGVAVNTNTASANVQLGDGWRIWTREYCASGRFVNMRRLTFGSDVQGREYVYRRDGRLCAFVVDHMAGSHWMGVFAHHGKSWGIDTGYYSQYAGAVAGPRGACIWVQPSLDIYRNGSTYQYGRRWRLYC